MTTPDQRAETERGHARRDQSTPCGQQPIRKPGAIDRLALRPGLVSYAKCMVHERVELTLSPAIAASGSDDRADPDLEGEPPAGGERQRQRLTVEALGRKDAVEIEGGEREGRAQLFLVR